MFLEQILAVRRQTAPPDAHQVQQWQDAVHQAPAPRGFARALRQGEAPRIIAEFKRASPSKGILRADMDPAEQALAYAHGGAVAISVLTEPHYFQGSQADLQAVRAACDLPVLRKDFLLEDWEIWQSRCWGADAVLLIAAALPLPRLQRMLALCSEVGLDALVEVHSLQEAREVAALQPHLVGINNRNLESFRVDLDVTRQVLPILPANCLKVAESGFQTAEQIREFAGVDAFLIGETLVRAQDPGQCLKELRGLPINSKETT